MCLFVVSYIYFFLISFCLGAPAYPGGGYGAPAGGMSSIPDPYSQQPAYGYGMPAAPGYGAPAPGYGSQW